MIAGGTLESVDAANHEYLEAYRARFAQARSEERARGAAALAVARAIAELLVGSFQARRVVLIGSLARGTFRWHSDVDLVVEGVPPDRFFAACAAADRLAGDLAVDLVPLEDAGSLIHQRVASEGKELARAA